MKLSTKLLIINIFFVVAIIWTTLNYFGGPGQQTLGVFITVWIATLLGNILLIRGARVRQ